MSVWSRGFTTTGIVSGFFQDWLHRQLFEIIKRCKCNDLQKLRLTFRVQLKQTVMFMFMLCERSRFHHKLHSNDVQTCRGRGGLEAGFLPPGDLTCAECCRFILWATICSLQLFAITDCSSSQVLVLFQCDWAIKSLLTSRCQHKTNIKERNTLQIQQKRLFRGRKAKFISVQLSRWN